MEDQGDTSNLDIFARQKEINIYFSPETLFYRFIITTLFSTAARAYC